MTTYRFYLLNGDDLVDAWDFLLADDKQALEQARALCQDFDVEVWEGARLLARLAPESRPVEKHLR